MTTATDTVEETTVEEIAAGTTPSIHLARCGECAHAVKFKPSASGAGFMVLETETAYGISANGLPLCPNGHGEMAMADEQLPVGDAFEQVAEQVQPQQAALPGVFPPFNYQGAYLELEEKAVEVDRLKGEWEDDKEAAAASKKAWERAAETYTKMALEFQRRRREKVAAGDPVSDVDLSRCVWEQAHPDAHCPLCTEEKNQDQEHVAEIDAWLLGRSVGSVVDALDSQAMWVSPDVIRAWSQDERDSIEGWAKAMVEGTPAGERPAVLGTMHVAGVAVIDQPQTCTQCDVVLAESDALRYETGTLVGTDCKGKPAEAHRYPKSRHAKKKAKK